MKWIFGVLCVAMLGYEAYAIYTPETGDTISEMVWSVASYPFIPFVSGFLCGHFFWQKRS